MEWVCKALLTAAAVAAVMLAAGRLDRRLVGLLAGLPLVSAPALLWLAHEQGPVFAAGTAAGSVAACAASALYARVAVALLARCGAVVALGGALAASALVVAALHGLQQRPGAVLAACALVCAALRPTLRLDAPAGAVRPLRGEPWLSAGLSGLVAVAVSQSPATLGAYGAGLLASLPVITSFALLHLHRGGTAADQHRFLLGYLHGTWGKAVFATVFAFVAPAWGSGWAAALAAAGGLAAMALLAAAGRRPRPRRGDAGSRPAAPSILRCPDPPPT